jgi:hypothetical protein
MPLIKIGQTKQNKSNQTPTLQNGLRWEWETKTGFYLPAAKNTKKSIHRRLNKSAGAGFAVTEENRTFC